MSVLSKNKSCHMILNDSFKLKVLIFGTFYFTLVCGLQWSDMNVIPLAVTWIFQLLFLYITFNINSSKNLINSDWNLLKVYLAWCFFNIIRGALFYTLGNYWIWKSLIVGSFDVLIPSLVYVYSNPQIIGKILRYWYKYALFLFVILFPFLSKGAYHFYLGPIYIVGCFWSIYKRKWRCIILFLLLLMMVADYGARSQVIKTGVVFLLSIGYIYRRFITYSMLKAIHWICYILPIILLILGLSGTFNIFEDLSSSNEGKYVEQKIDKDGNVVDDDLSSDTRTFIFVEIINSAINNNYVIWGRTPARGNDSLSFGAVNAEDLKTGLYERHANETGLPSLFTWLGLVGLVLLSLIYLRSSYLAVYKSNNLFIKYLGCFVAFRWAYGWIEDMYCYQPMILALWMMIGMCISEKFRNMNDAEMKLWLIKLVK